MAAKSALLGSSLVKKYWMALTGLFLCVFLIVHLAGNLQLLDRSMEGVTAFNEYTLFMTSFLPVKIVSYILYFSILFHSIDGLLILTIQNRAARPIGYAYSRPQRNSIWSSRNMGVLGTAVLIFIVIHMGNFWFKYKFTEMPVDHTGLKDMHAVVLASFGEAWYVALYVLSMIALGFHLWHGFASSFQSMGWNHPKYNPLIRTTGHLFAVIVPALFAMIPLYIFFNH